MGGRPHGSPRRIGRPRRTRGSRLHASKPSIPVLRSRCSSRAAAPIGVDTWQTTTSPLVSCAPRARMRTTPRTAPLDGHWPRTTRTQTWCSPRRGVKIKTSGRCCASAQTRTRSARTAPRCSTRAAQRLSRRAVRDARFCSAPSCSLQHVRASTRCPHAPQRRDRSRRRCIWRVAPSFPRPLGCCSTRVPTRRWSTATGCSRSSCCPRRRRAAAGRRSSAGSVQSWRRTWRRRMRCCATRRCSRRCAAGF